MTAMPAREPPVHTVVFPAKAAFGRRMVGDADAKGGPTSRCRDRARSDEQRQESAGRKIRLAVPRHVVGCPFTGHTQVPLRRGCQREQGVQSGAGRNEPRGERDEHDE